MEGVLKEGEKVKVKLIGIDHKTGKFKLSRKVLMPKPDGAPRAPQGNGAAPQAVTHRVVIAIIVYKG